MELLVQRKPVSLLGENSAWRALQYKGDAKMGWGMWRGSQGLPAGEYECEGRQGFQGKGPDPEEGPSQREVPGPG